MLTRCVATFDQWRDAARPLLKAGVAAQAVQWFDARSTAPASASGDVDDSSAPVALGRPLVISPRLLGLLGTVALFRHPGRWELMYRLVSRTMMENSQLLNDPADPDVSRAMLMETAVRRDIHKMHAFVRFRSQSDEPEAFFAWFEPEHEILRRGADFFVDRFRNMLWTIATPDGAAVWDLQQLRFIDPPDASLRPRSDQFEDLWRTYYRSICNVARINPAAMQREMPQRYWRHLPEATEIDRLLREGASSFAKKESDASVDVSAMSMAAKRTLPPEATVGEQPQTCRRCDLWKQATQAVMGEGASIATIMLVGEQPGDEEDLRGHPFVGPAGKVLDQAIAAAGLHREQLFITNAVKHFKWEPRGKRRLHKKPSVGEINACHLWLEREIASVAPRVIVALGASALRSLTGATLSIDSARRQELNLPGGARIIATYHPSAILRAQDERIEELRTALVSDLSRAREIVEGGPHGLPT